MIVKHRFLPQKSAYFSGADTGLTYINNVPKSCEIIALSAETLQFVAKIRSRDDGHYLMPYLDPDKKYLLFARDLSMTYEPFAYDHAKPLNNLSISEQADLIASWQK